MSSAQVQRCGKESGKVKVTQWCLTLCKPLDYAVHGILQPRVLEWVAIPSSRGSSQPRDRTQVYCIAGRFFTSWATREALGPSTPINHQCSSWPNLPLWEAWGSERQGQNLVIHPGITVWWLVFVLADSLATSDISHWTYHPASFSTAHICFLALTLNFLLSAQISPFLSSLLETMRPFEISNP